MADFDVGRFISGLLDLSSGVRGAGQNRGATAAGMADPFASQRGKYVDQLLEMVKNPAKFDTKTFDPGTYTESVGYKFGREQGLEGVNRAGNAMFGSTRSGNTAIELEKFATGFAQQDYDKWKDASLREEGLFNQEQDAQRTSFMTEQDRQRQALMALSGVNAGSPLGAADAYLKGFVTDDKNIAGGLQGGLGGLLNLVGGTGGLSNLVSRALGMFGGTTGAGGSSDGGLGGALDTPPGEGGDAPGSTGPQFDWEAFDADPGSYLDTIFGGGDGGSYVDLFGGT